MPSKMSAFSLRNGNTAIVVDTNALMESPAVRRHFGLSLPDDPKSEWAGNLTSGSNEG